MLDDPIDPRFGRCEYFIIINPATMAFEAIENSSAALSGGAGIQAAQLVADKSVDVVLTGRCGPNALNAFKAAGIKVVTGVSGQVREAVGAFTDGSMTAAVSPKAQAPDSGSPVRGLGGGGRGVGGGRRMGGGGRGMGGGGTR